MFLLLSFLFFLFPSFFPLLSSLSSLPCTFLSIWIDLEHGRPLSPTTSNCLSVQYLSVVRIEEEGRSSVLCHRNTLGLSKQKIICIFAI